MNFIVDTNNLYTLLLAIYPFRIESDLSSNEDLFDAMSSYALSVKMIIIDIIFSSTPKCHPH